jgi:hypothetical protein
MLDITTSLGVWIPQVQGQYIDMDGAAGAQCWDLAAHWSAFLGLPRISTLGKGRWPGWAGNMVDAFPQSPEIAAAYELIDPNAPMLPGDIVVWGDSYPVWYPKTHVAVGVLDQGANLVCMSQNSTPSQAGNPYPMWTTGPTVKQQLPRRGCIGFIRPRAGGTISLQGTITPQEDELSQADVERIINEITANVEAKHVVTRSAINDARDSINFSTQQQVEAVGRVTQQLIIDKAQPAVIAEQIDKAGLAQAVANELAKRLVK